MVEYQDEGTLNCFLDTTKVQLREAVDQRIIRPTTMIGGIRVSSVEDIAAMELKVLLDRGELRDNFDLMKIDQDADVTMEDALDYFIERYRPATPGQSVTMIVRSLGYLGDVRDDPALPVRREAIEQFWKKRQPQIVRSLDQW